MDRRVAPRAAFALALFFLAVMPLAAAETGHEPLDETGPFVASVGVDPNPVVPDLVRVTGFATDAESPIALGEAWIDAPGPNGTSFFRMRPADMAFDSPAEGMLWLGPYFTFTQGVAPGFHEIFVHAMDLLGNWGPYATFTFFVGHPSNTGPTVSSLTASPEEAPLGTDLVLDALASDPFLGAVVAAEFFLDGQGPDGNGIPMTGSWGDSTVVIRGSEIAALTPGAHVAYVHALNDRGLWGTPAGVGFTVRAPALSFRIAVSPDQAVPGGIVTYSVRAENHGNANATEVWIDIGFPSTLTYVDDDAAASGGERTGPSSWRFADLSAFVEFYIRLQVSADATDGLSLAAGGTLDLTNENLWDFPPIAATTVGDIIAPELRVAVSAPATVYAAEPFQLVIDVVHSGIRAIPLVKVDVDLGPLGTRLGDNAVSLGGAFVNGAWLFPDLAPGTHRFVITEAIGTEAVDLSTVQQHVTVRYASRTGVPVSLDEFAETQVMRPLVELAIEPQRLEAMAGDPITVNLDYANRGSAAAREVDIEFTLPTGLVQSGGPAPDVSVGSRLTWRLLSLAPEATGRLTVVLVAERELAANLRFELAYTSPAGQPLARVSARASLFAAVSVAPNPLPSMAAVALLGSSVVVAALVATERSKAALLFLLFVPLYTRLRHEKVLDHETRGMIRGYIVANPGDHYNSIKEALELPNGTLAYHIQVLQKEMIVRSVKDGKFRRFYPAEMRVPEGGEPTKIQRVILELIRANPGITPRDAAGFLGLTSSTVSYHLEKLEEHRRVEYRREGITKRLYVAGDLGL